MMVEPCSCPRKQRRASYHGLAHLDLQALRGLRHNGFVKDAAVVHSWIPYPELATHNIARHLLP